LWKEWLAEILFFIALDCRNYHLVCDCHSCTDDEVVRLARVWLLASTDNYGRRTCRILYIDSRPPHRRFLGRDCPPIARHCENAAALALWRHPDEACVALADAGIAVRGRQEVKLPKSPDELWKLLECPPFLCCGQEIVLQVLEHCLFGCRVVGWCGDEQKPKDPYGRKPEPPYELKPERPYEPKPDRPDNSNPEPPYQNEQRRGDPSSEHAREDDLTAIDGIGPSRAESCKSNGITTYAALARVSLEDLRSLLGIPEDTAQAILEEARVRAGGGEGSAEA
jgi:predicted flap endonuclease-1-like 5' DNA nuclease